MSIKIKSSKSEALLAVGIDGDPKDFVVFEKDGAFQAVPKVSEDDNQPIPLISDGNGGFVEMSKEFIDGEIFANSLI